VTRPRPADRSPGGGSAPIVDDVISDLRAESGRNGRDGSTTEGDTESPWAALEPLRFVRVGHSAAARAKAALEAARGLCPAAAPDVRKTDRRVHDRPTTVGRGSRQAGSTTVATVEARRRALGKCPARNARVAHPPPPTAPRPSPRPARRPPPPPPPGQAAFDRASAAPAQSGGPSDRSRLLPHPTPRDTSCLMPFTCKAGMRWFPALLPGVGFQGGSSSLLGFAQLDEQSSSAPPLAQATRYRADAPR